MLYIYLSDIRKYSNHLLSQWVLPISQCSGEECDDGFIVYELSRQPDLQFSKLCVFGRYVHNVSNTKLAQN